MVDFRPTPAEESTILAGVAVSMAAAADTTTGDEETILDGIADSLEAYAADATHFTIDNLISPSNDFDGTGWTLSAATLLEGDDTDPFAGALAWGLVDTAANVVHTLQSPAIVTDSDVNYYYTASIYAKAGTLEHLEILLPAELSATSAVFDLTAGTVASGTGVIEALADDWFRCSVTGYAVDVSGTSKVLFYLHNGTTHTYLGSVEKLLIYGAQCVLGTSAGTYTETP